jgi:hypothetical protein
MCDDEPNMSASRLHDGEPDFDRRDRRDESRAGFDVRGTDTLLALQHLLDHGVITPEEYQGLCARVPA